MSDKELNSIIDRAEDEYQKLKDKVIEQSLEIERLNKGYCKFKEECGKYATCLRENQLKEIERLNNIINELEKDIIEKINDIKNNYSQVNGNYFNMNYVLDTYEDVLNRLQELKGSDN